MTARTIRLDCDLSADEFIASGDEYSELIQGEVRPKPMPGKLHSQLCAWEYNRGSEPFEKAHKLQAQDIEVQIAELFGI